VAHYTQALEDEIKYQTRVESLTEVKGAILTRFNGILTVFSSLNEVKGAHGPTRQVQVRYTTSGPELPATVEEEFDYVLDCTFGHLLGDSRPFNALSRRINLTRTPF